MDLELQDHRLVPPAALALVALMAIDTGLYSPWWGAVAHSRPQLRGHVQMHRHLYRGQPWYVLQDPVSGRFHRFGPAAYRLIAQLDGQRTLDEVWQDVVATLGGDAPTQDETIQLLGTLHGADALSHEGALHLDALFERRDRHRRRQWLQRVRSPLAIRLPLLDPDRLLDWLYPLARPLLGLVGLLLWMALVLAASVMAVMHWEGLAADLSSQLMSINNLPLLIGVFILVKSVHELGHGLMVKRWGGEMHELGIMLLVFMPVPYVDASAATAYPSKWQRALVGAAGILVELTLAAIAMFVWLEAESGLVRAIAFNVMVVGGVSTLLFNGNPLLRFDGYYVFADLLEIPNLFTRANRYFFYLVQRYLFGMGEVRSPVTARGERGWLLFYAIASFCYRMFLMAIIVMFVASMFFTLGILLAAWSVLQMLVWPLLKGLHFLFNSPRLERRRGRAWLATGLFVAGVVLPVTLVPAPYATMGEGVVWVPDRAEVHATASGFVAEVIAEPGKPVRRGDPLIVLDAPLLDAEIRVMQAQVRELQVRRALAAVSDRVQERITGEELALMEARLEDAERRRADLVVTSPVDGILALPSAQHLTGRYLRRGEPVALIVDPQRPVVRSLIPQERIDLVMTRTREVLARPAAEPGRVLMLTDPRLSPLASTDLPSLALTSEGGGKVPLDPSNGQRPSAMEPYFLFEAEAPGLIGADSVGGRLQLRFDHGNVPLGQQLYRALRQVFLERLNV
ncbi:biotin/lipoyl-binding protein [Halomonas sp. 3H]|uniref:biotin/lipoyl-binding protein n=1 Tax=Halomonas sp. 3H TaxID=2952527 RepID=UPI0020B8F0D6|nr:biotin/lipoyl-binding protein [Halomonas sp. 3H]